MISGCTIMVRMESRSKTGGRSEIGVADICFRNSLRRRVWEGVFRMLMVALNGLGCQSRSIEFG